MEAVQSFNQEMTSLYEVKPPISKAKMTSITKGAIRAIKFYKHVVQSVEKFIQKCKPEYKIPGLYVIDSIVRQSRHQFGPDKDVFAPRFAKNAQITFYHLYKCSEEEKSKVIRVLNLWQKNNVFHSDAIQPLFDMANPQSEIYKKLDHQMKTTGKIALSEGTPVKEDRKEGKHERVDGGRDSNGGIDSAALKQLQTIQQFLKNPPPVQFNKKLLDFDYGSDDDSEGGAGGEPVLNQAALDAVKALLGNPTLLNHLKANGDINQQQITQLQQLLPQAIPTGQPPQQQLPPPPQPASQQFTIPGLGGPQATNFSTPIGGGPQFMGAPPPGFPPHMAPVHGGAPGYPAHPPPMMGGFGPPPGYGPPRQSPLEEGEHAGDTDDDVMMIDEVGVGVDKRSRGGKDRRRSRDRRSRSRSGSRGKRSKRRRGDRSKSRSRSRDRRGKRRSRSRERDREDKKRRQEDEKREIEKMEERKKKGLPPLKEGHLTVCSTTLWVGHLSKLVQEDDLSDNFGTYGEIVSIDLIPPRGCAFVCMNRRMDANRALKNLNKFKLQGKPITLAWAPGKGMKDKQWKDYWDLDLGCSYIPIEKLDPQVNMMELEEGGMFDEETMPDWMRSMRGVSHRASLPPPGQGFPTHADPGLPGMGQLPPTLPGMGPPQELGGMPPMPPMDGIHPPFGLPPPNGPPGLLGHPPGLLPPPGAPLLGAPAGPNLLLRPGFPHPGAPMVSGPPPGFPGFDSSQPPPTVRMQGPGALAGVIGAPPGMPATAGLLQSPRPTLSGPPGLLGPPPNTSGVAPPTGPPIGQGPMDLEEQGDPGREHDDRRDRGRDRDRDRDRDRRDRDGDRRSGGRWEDRDDRRDRDRGRDERGRDDRRGSGRFGRDDDRGNRRDSRWGRDEDRRDRDGGRRDGRRGSGRFGRDDDRGNRRDSRWGRDEDRRDRDGGRRDGRRDDREMDDVGSRLQSLAEGGPVSLLDMPDIPRPEDMPTKKDDRARSEGEKTETDSEREGTENSKGQFPKFGNNGQSFGGPSGFGPSGFEGPPGFTGSRGFGGAQDGPPFGGGPPGFGSPGFDGPFRGRGGRGRGGWRGRGGPDGPFRGGPDMGFRGRGGPRGGRGSFGGSAGHWNDGSNESGPPFGSFGGNDGGFEGFDDGFRGRGRSRGRGRGGWEERGRGRGGFGGFGEWDQEGNRSSGRGRGGLLDGEFNRGGGRGGFGEWNKNKEDKERESEKDERREDRRRDRKSRWGAKESESDQQEVGIESEEANGHHNKEDAGLQAHDAPKTPPDEYGHDDSFGINNEIPVDADNNVERIATIASDATGSQEAENVELGLAQHHQSTPEIPDPVSVTESSNVVPYDTSDSIDVQPTSECSKTSADESVNNCAEQSDTVSEQPAYDLLGDLGAAVAPPPQETNSESTD